MSSSLKVLIFIPFVLIACSTGLTKVLTWSRYGTFEEEKFCDIELHSVDLPANTNQKVQLFQYNFLSSIEEHKC